MNHISLLTVSGFHIPNRKKLGGVLFDLKKNDTLDMSDRPREMSNKSYSSCKLLWHFILHLIATRKIAKDKWKKKKKLTTLGNKIYFPRSLGMSLKRTTPCLNIKEVKLHKHIHIHQRLTRITPSYIELCSDQINCLGCHKTLQVGCFEFIQTNRHEGKRHYNKPIELVEKKVWKINK